MIKKYFYAFMIGTICLFAFAPFNFLPALFLSYALFSYLLSSDADQPKKAFYYGHAFGFGFFLSGLYWVGNALLVDLEQFLLFLPFAYLGLPFALAFFYAVPAYLAKKICNRHSNILFFIALASLLSFSDILRGFIFTGFPWNLPVYATAFSNEMMQMAYYLGAYGYNILIVFFALSFGLYFYDNIKKHYVIIVHICTIGCIIAVGQYRLSHIDLLEKNDVIYRVIQPNIAQHYKWSQDELENHFQTLLTLSSENIDQRKKYVFIWPETALPFHPEHNIKVMERIQAVLNGKHAVITGKMRFKPRPSNNGYYFYNSIFYIDAERTITSFYDKIHLVPFGEYLPLRPLAQLLGIGQINHFQSGFSEGTRYEPLSIGGGTYIGAQICYEIVFPEGASSVKHHGANLLVNVTNDAWFGKSSGPYQHLIQTRFRAVENGIMILRSANTGISAAIDPTGKVINLIGLSQSGYRDYVIFTLK